MNFKAHALMKSNPTLSAKVKVEPLKFDTSASGSFSLHVGSLAAYIGEVGVRMAIPFLRPRRRMPLVGTVGGFHIRLRPFHVESKGIQLHLSGILATEGAAAEMETKVGCQTEMDVHGNLPLKVGKVRLDVCEVDELDD